LDNKIFVNAVHVSDGVPSIIRSSKLYIGQQAYVKQLLLLAASGDEIPFHNLHS